MARAGGDDDPIGDDELPDLFRLFEGRRIALAVSGGVDSMVLLHLVHRWLSTDSGRAWLEDHRRGAVFMPRPRDRPVGLPRRRPRGLQSAAWLGQARTVDGLAQSLIASPVVVLTVDHGLRAGSAEEAAFVMSTAVQLGFAHQTLVWRHQAGTSETDTADARPATAIQEKAREARLGLMADCIEDETWTLFEANEIRADPLSAGHQKRAIVTAHHRDDLVETFLMRLKRGSGLDGLSSIRSVEPLRRTPTPERRYPTVADIVRPLLDVPKSRLIATARAGRIAWRDDPSNAKEDFERVRLRRELPALEALGFAPAMLRLSIRRLQRAREVVRTHEAERLVEWTSSPGLIDVHEGLYASVDLQGPGLTLGEVLSPLGGKHEEVMLRILRHLIHRLGGQADAPGLAQVEELRRHLARGIRDPGASSGQTLGGCRIDHVSPRPGHHDGRIRIWREAGRCGLPELELESGDGGWWDNRFAVSVSVEAPGPVTVKALGREGWTGLRRRMPALTLWRGVPPGAPASLPAIWRGDTLVAVPFFEVLPRSLDPLVRREIEQEWEASSGLTGSHYTVRFAPDPPI